MTISYQWLSEYLPWPIEPVQLSKILTSIGLEVERLEHYEPIKGGLAGLVIGEVLTCEQHPNADKLKVTTVNIGKDAPIQVVCGAANVAAKQKVVVATVGTTIYPVEGAPMTMKVAKIRGVESHGMICAEDEIGVGTSHAGIMVLPDTLQPGTPAAAYFEPYSDWVYEIGLTPNRMDAMSHYGVAKDVCAWLTHHEKPAKPVSPFNHAFQINHPQAPIKVTIENTRDCQRYAGVSISGVTVAPSPQWLKNRLMAIGLRSINNIVDITNYILHESGQPLHAFDADAITGGQVVVRNLSEGSAFITLDEKERKLSAEDLMICNAQEGMCIAGVFGGTKSGVTNATRNIFLESAWFHPVSIRKTSLRHGLRTDAATRFEKGVDISQCVEVLKRAAVMIQSIAGGSISSEVVDVYPNPQPKNTVTVTYAYIRKLSGKAYQPEKIKQLLASLGFDILHDTTEALTLAVPYSKPDINIPADIVEEIVRIDGLDNIDIPSTITISPAIEKAGFKEVLKDKIASYLVGRGFVEIFTNSITNSQYFSEEVLSHAVKMLNNLSAELDVLRPSMLETGLETIAYNINRKNQQLQLFEFGKTYHTSGAGNYNENEHLCLYLSGSAHEQSWRHAAQAFDLYTAKGLVTALGALAGLGELRFVQNEEATHQLNIFFGEQKLGTLEEVPVSKKQAFDIRQSVVYVDLNVTNLMKAAAEQKIVYAEVNKFPSMQRDLAMVVDRAVTYQAIESVAQQVKLPRLKQMRLFDVFESDKLGAGKKSMAISFTFVDEEKTMTDKEADTMVAKLIQAFEQQLGAEVRR